MKNALLEAVKKGEVSGDYEYNSRYKPIRRRRNDLLINRSIIDSRPVEVGAKVAIAQRYTVLDIYEGVALCLPEGGGGLVEIPISMLVCV